MIVELSHYAHKWIQAVNLSNGDVSIQNQKPILSEKPDILISTPSRMASHLKQGNVTLDTLESLVIDEADLILSYGYETDMKDILGFLPSIYQSWLMSATMSPDIDQLKKLILRNPAIIKLQEFQDPTNLEQFVLHCDSDLDRYLYTFFIVKLKVFPFGSGKCILFVNSIDQCYKLKLFFEQFGIKSCTLNSELPLKSRFHVVQEFNRGVYDILIATDESGDLTKMKEVDSSSDDDSCDSDNNDNCKNNQDQQQVQEEQQVQLEEKKKVKKRKTKKNQDYGVSRGIDFKNVNAVINFDIPKSHKSYMHRVGRTARGVGNKGYALTFVRKGSDLVSFEKIVKKQEKLKRNIQHYEFNSSQIEGFKYRVEDGLSAVTGASVKEARIKDLKSEILTSEKLKAHFEANPKDLHALRHDKPLHPSRVQSHMKHIPDYLLPKSLKDNNGQAEFKGFVPFHKNKKWTPSQVKFHSFCFNQFRKGKEIH